LEFSKEQVDRLVRGVAFAEAAKNKRVFISGPMGLPLEATNELASVDLKLESGSCEGCVSLELLLDGSSEVGSGLSNLKAPMSWDIGVSGVLALDLKQQEVMAVPRTDWAVNSAVTGLPTMMNDTAASAMKNMIANEMVKAKMDAPFKLLKVPENLPFQIARLGFEESETLSIGAGLHLMTRGKLQSRKSPDHGWRIRIPEQTLFGVVDALLLGQPPAGGFATEVESLSIGEQMVLTLRIIRATRKAPERLVRLTLSVELAEMGNLKVVLVEVMPADKGWHTVGTRFVGLKGMQKWMKKSVEQSFPTVWVSETPGLRFQTRLRSVGAEDGELVLAGDIGVEALINNDGVGEGEKTDAEGSSPMD